MEKSNVLRSFFSPTFDLYLDGKLLLSQGDFKSQKEYVLTNGIEASFRVTKKSHTISLRISNFMMKGIYAKPFQLRPFQENDFFINFWDFLLKDLLVISGSAALIAGLLFLFVFLKTREAFYKIPSIMGVICGISLISWSGLFNKFIGINAGAPLLYMTILPSGIYAPLFVRQYFNIKWYWLIPAMILGLCSVMFIFVNPGNNLSLFLTIRKVGFGMAIPSSLILIFLMIRNKAKLGDDFTALMIGQGTLCIMAIYSVLTALGISNGYNLMHFGFIGSIGSVLYLSTKNFAKTYLDNQKNLKEVTELKDNLEIKVEERTVELAEEKNSVSNLLHNMGQAVFSVDIYGVIQDKRHK